MAKQNETGKRIRGHGIIWDAKNKKPLCKFDKDGYLYNPDESVIKALSAYTDKNGNPLYPVETIAGEA